MRLFAAILFEKNLKNELISYLGTLKRAGVSGRYTSEGNLHLTLAFIGEEPSPARALEALRSLSFAPFTLSLSGATGRFGEILWAGFVPCPALNDAVGRLRSALKERGVPYDEKRFAPHVTLVRAAPAVLPSLPAPKSLSMTVGRISLMASERRNGALFYREIGSVCASPRSVAE